MSNPSLKKLASNNVRLNREKLLEVFQSCSSLLIGSFNVGLDDILSELKVKYCYIVASDVISSDRSAASPDAPQRIFDNLSLQDRIATEHAMLRLIKAHHAKYWVSGLKDDEVPRGIFFSGDLMPSALSPEDLSNSHEILIDLTESESRELVNFGRWVMKFRPAKDVLSSHNQALNSPNVGLPKFKHLLLTNPNHSLRKDVLKIIDQAEKSIVVTTWLLDDNCEVVKRLIAAARTKEVTIIADENKLNSPALEKLASTGAKVLICPKMHAKILLIDLETNPSAIITSANLLNEGYESGLEIGLRINRDDQRIQYLKDFLSERIPLCEPLVISKNTTTVNTKTQTDSLKNIKSVIKLAKPIKIF
jgi:PLD-like domain